MLGAGVPGSAGGVAGGGKKVELPHQLSLKVMRLAKPAFVTAVPLFEREEELHMDPALKLAAAFGEIYMGETFSCYLTVQNGSSELVTSVVVKAELQTTSKRYMLHNLEPAPLPVLAPEQCEDSVLSRVICDEGVHILVCTASYLTPAMGRRSFRKFFKFNVTHPFSLSHRQLQCPAGPGRPADVAVETELENNTPSVLCVTGVRLVCNEQLFVGVATEAAAAAAAQATVYVPPSCCVQFVHRLAPLRGAETGAYPAPQAALGYLELSWARGWGEQGTLLSPPLLYSPPARDPLEARLEALAEPLVAGRPVAVRCRVSNTHHYDTHCVRLHLSNGPGAAALLMGLSGAELPPIPPRQHITVDLTLLPLRPGMHQLGGIVLETAEKETYVCNNLATVVIDQHAGLGGGADEAPKQRLEQEI